MVNSRSIDDLRPDVAANAKTFVSMMKERGFPVGISSTHRDDEYQAWLYAQGRTRDLDKPKVTGSATTTFHGAKLAFDIYHNVKGDEWNNPRFWAAADVILAQMGFSRLTNEKCHAQWSDGGKYSGSQVRAGTVPKNMPPFKLETYKDKLRDRVIASGPDFTPTTWAFLDTHPQPEELYKRFYNMK